MLNFATDPWCARDGLQCLAQPLSSFLYGVAVAALAQQGQQEGPLVMAPAPMLAQATAAAG